jgi:hypothetical protein
MLQCSVNIELITFETLGKPLDKTIGIHLHENNVFLAKATLCLNSSSVKLKSLRLLLKIYRNYFWLVIVQFQMLFFRQTMTKDIRFIFK